MIKYDVPEDTLPQSNPRDTLRPALADVIKSAQAANHAVVLIIDEHAFLRCDFRKSLKSLLDVGRCGNHLLTEESGGVLVLGTVSSDVPYCGKQHGDTVERECAIRSGAVGGRGRAGGGERGEEREDSV